MNNYEWVVKFRNVNSNDLRRSDGSFTVGVTDLNQMSIFLCDRLKGNFLKKVLIHELVHAFMFSYNYHLTIEEEEFVCDFVASNAEDILEYSKDILLQMKDRLYA